MSINHCLFIYLLFIVIIHCYTVIKSPKNASRGGIAYGMSFIFKAKTFQRQSIIKMLSSFICAPGDRLSS